MVHGHSNGMRVDDPAFRSLFRRESVLSSHWYQERLRTKQNRDIALWNRHLAALEAFRASFHPGSAGTGPGRPFGVEGTPRHPPGPGSVVPASSLEDLEYRLAFARQQSARVESPGYLEELYGTIGADPFHGQIAPPPPA